jgi:hypothetical protein
MCHHRMMSVHRSSLTLAFGAQYILGDFHRRDANDGGHGENDLPAWKPGTTFRGDDGRIS